MEVKAYQVSTRAPSLVKENGLLLREDTELPGDTGELLKSEFNREVGKYMDRLTGTEMGFTRLGVRFLLDIEIGTVEAQLSSAFACGHYQKSVRDIPQVG